MKIFSVLALLTLAASPAFAADAAVPATTLPEINHLVYLSELPETADLMASAAANGLTVTRLDRTSDRVVVTYSYPNGQTATLGYALLSSAGNADRVAPRRTVTTVTRAPEVVYVERPYATRVVYNDPYDNFWLPLTLGVGLGWATSYHGHYHGGYHGHGHGGWHHR
jgi:hypothetical protein